MDASSASGGSSGRRGNGLPSSDWGALVDIDPRLSEALLASLASADVPAFVEPAAGHNTWTCAAEAPARPLDRLWVAPLQADAARRVLSAEIADLTALLAEAEPGATAYGLVQAVPRSAGARVLPPPVLPEPPRAPQSAAAGPTGPGAAGPAAPAPAPPAGPGAGAGGADTDAGEAAARDRADAGDGPPDVSAQDPDEVWRQIVEGFGREAESPVPPWPVVEDVDPPRGRTWPSRAERAGDETPRRRRNDPPPAEAALPDWVEPEALEDEGHYVPPAPPPVPRLAPQKLAAAGTLLAGLLLVFAPGLLLQPPTSGVMAFGLLVSVGGAAALVWLMRDAPPTGSGPDDGAVV